MFQKTLDVMVITFFFQYKIRTMSRTYRNSLKSKEAIKNAFITLCAENNTEEITITRIMEKADLSRNTFYSHYQGLFEVSEEIEGEFFKRLTLFLDEAIRNRQISDPLPLLMNIGSFLEQNKEINRALINSNRADKVIEKLKQLFINKVIDNIDTSPIRDKMGFMVYLEYTASGAVSLYTKYLRDEIDMNINEISQSINRFYIAGMKTFL